LIVAAVGYRARRCSSPALAHQLVARPVQHRHRLLVFALDRDPRVAGQSAEPGLEPEEAHPGPLP